MKIQEAVKALIEKYQLEQLDYYANYETGEKIISGNGIRRMIFIESINITKRLSHLSDDGKIAVVMCEAHSPKIGRTYQALGEASPDNNTFKYPVNVAEKRAEARAVLNVLGLYAQGWRGEDEIDDKVEGNKISEKRKMQTATATTATQEKIAAPRTKRKPLKLGPPAGPPDPMKIAHDQKKPGDDLQADA